MELGFKNLPPCKLEHGEERETVFRPNLTTCTHGFFRLIESFSPALF